MISVEEALDRILGAMEPLPAETVSVAEALGRVLAEDLAARVDQPPADVSAMDGYAVRAADLEGAPVTLKLVGEAPAGGAYDAELGPGESVRIFTGAPLPEGADAIVIQEDAEAKEDRVTVAEAVPAGRYRRPRGLDFKAGDIGVAAGRLMTVRDVGLAAAMNRPWLAVRRRPRVAILATGDEVVMPGDPLRANQIPSSNGLALSAFVSTCGGDPIHLGIAPDERGALGSMLDGARGADLIVTSGGASVGKHDLVQSVLDDRGMELDFWKIAMRPGKPLIFGSVGGTPLVGLPGNPVSSLVCATIFLRPALNKLQGRDQVVDPPLQAVLTEPLEANDRRQDYLRATLEGGGNGQRLVTPAHRQDSSMLATLSHCDCLIVRPPEAPPAAAGDTVTILPLTGGHLNI